MSKTKFYESEEFKQLQAEWYQKLAETPVVTTKKVKKLGTVRYQKQVEFFIDIEGGKDQDTFESQVFTEMKSQYDGGTDYRNYCLDVLEGYEFENKDSIDYVIFKKHTEGLSERQIKLWLDIQGVYGKISRSSINRTIERIKDRYNKGLLK